MGDDIKEGNMKIVGTKGKNEKQQDKIYQKVFWIGSNLNNRCPWIQISNFPFGFPQLPAEFLFVNGKHFSCIFSIQSPSHLVAYLEWGGEKDVD